MKYDRESLKKILNEKSNKELLNKIKDLSIDSIKKDDNYIEEVNTHKSNILRVIRKTIGFRVMRSSRTNLDEIRRDAWK